MKLIELIAAVPGVRVRGGTDLEILGLRYDSRKVQQNDLFFAWKGAHSDGHAFIAEACHRGARAVVGENPNAEVISDTTYVLVPRAREALALMADRFYDHPSRSLHTIGITGTNGKTTTAFVTKYLLSKLGSKVGLLGTVRYEIGDEILSAARTTPEGSDLHGLLARMHEEHCTAVVMEVSSHALDQGRVAGVEFQVAVWTNLTPDHLDYHETMEKYFDAKQRLFAGLRQGDRPCVAVVNLDDKYGQLLVSKIPPGIRLMSYSCRGASGSVLRAEKIVAGEKGTTFALRWDGATHQVSIPLVGRFNVENVLAAVGVLLGLGYPLSDLLSLLPYIPGVPGRLESFSSPDGVTAVVDYAHTPDALENVLQTLRGLVSARLIAVVGCGGDRDRTKRPVMAAVACRLADHVIFTSDNPRSEEIEDIFQDMRAGLETGSQVEWVSDRREAIVSAIQQAKRGDLVCVAGKGHETTQEIRGVRIPFADREVVREALLRRAA